MPHTTQPPDAPSAPELSEASRNWLSTRSAESRKGLGQYLTPEPVARALLDGLSLRPGMRVLDPGAGTGELLRAVREREPGADLTGWDVDQSALAAASRLVPEATLVHRSALDPAGEIPGYDLVVGNPPYFQVRPTPDQKRRFREVISGRANIFAFFFKAGLDALRPGGRLAYIVPPSMNSGAYFERLREHLIGRARITRLSVLEGADRFEGVNTAVQLLVLEKRAESTTDGGTGNEPFIFEHSSAGAGFHRVVFTEEPERLTRQFENLRTLWQLGYRASTGTVVWNQHRERLRDAPGPGAVRLIWSHDLGSGGPPVPGSRAGKPGYLTGREPRFGPAVFVNRVVGAVGRGELRTAYLGEGEPYLAENHVNVIRARDDPGASPVIGWDRLRKSLGGPEVVERVRLLTGNTQISASELTHLLPLA
ncbi:MAG: methyltransferase [Thermoleophilia bacterium]|nr:methyltransferase [Thermoleophilia bacterium]